MFCCCWFVIFLFLIIEIYGQIQNQCHSQITKKQKQKKKIQKLKCNKRPSKYSTTHILCLMLNKTLKWNPQKAVNSKVVVIVVAADVRKQKNKRLTILNCVSYQHQKQKAVQKNVNKGVNGNLNAIWFNSYKRIWFGFFLNNFFF